MNAILKSGGLQSLEGICGPLRLLFGLLAGGTALQAGSSGDEAWLATLLNPPSLTNVQLSPAGTRLAMIQNLPERSGSLLVTDLVEGKTSRPGSGDGLELYYLNWTGDDGLVFKVSNQVWNSFYDVGIYHTHVNRLRPDHPVDAGSSITVVGMPRERPKRMIAWVKLSAPSSSDQKPQHLGIVEYNVGISSASAFGRRPNARPIVHTYPSVPGAEFVSVRADRDGELGWCVTLADGKFSAYLWSITDSTWAPLRLDLKSVTPLGLDFDRRTLWCARTLPEGGSELVPYDCVDQAFGKPRLHDKVHPIANSTIFFSRVDRSLAGISYSRLRRQAVWFLRRFAAWQKMINEAYPGMDSHAVGISEDEQRLVFQLSAPNHPGLYALLDTSKPELRAIGSRHDGLDAAKLAPAKIIDVKSRDGRRTFAYLTLPRQPAAPPLPPLVVGVSDPSWSYSPVLQWLAAQGIAVLQPAMTYPALPVSTVYGGLHPGMDRLGNDVVDAVRAAVAGGQVDGGRVYVMGEHEGASLALHLSFAEPGLFRGVVAINGVYEWSAWLKQLEEWRSYSPGERLLARQIVEQGIPADFPYASDKCYRFFWHRSFSFFGVVEVLQG